jgi:hypothetical protein
MQHRLYYDARMELFIQAANIIVVIQAWMLLIQHRAIRLIVRPSITYAPMFERCR